ncbi:hypothetical protein OUZ56_014758 [Daphnia magna]|uniref:Uncharacterized protein n=1 Tax=Daphnia magna TaxID=35525 RepID=A0ABR0AL55_9CRUS|nr:hypothetical protein OUZ56_014758 [Daphnia magna]
MRERKNTEVLPPRFAVNMPVGGVSTLKLKRSEVGGWGLEQKRGGIGRDWHTINANTPKMFRTKSRKRNPKKLDNVRKSNSNTVAILAAD